jgi:transcriptional regulator with XRE-family HTH domain
MYERIRALREDKDMSQKEIAAEFHISQRTYSHYENGDRSIPTEILCKLAELHETSVDYLLGLTDEKKPYKQRKK